MAGRIWKILGFAVVTFVIILGLAMGGVALAYQNKYYPFVSVAGVNLSGQTKSEAAATLAKTVNNYLGHQVKIVVPDITLAMVGGEYQTKEFTAKASELGLKMADAQALDKAWGVGHQNNFGTWVKDLWQSLTGGKEMALGFNIDKIQLDTYLKTNIEPLITNPTPAKIVITGDQISIDPEKPGLAIDQNALSKSLVADLSGAGLKDVSLLKADAKVSDSPVTSANLSAVKDQLDAIGKVKVQFYETGFFKEPSRAELLTWFTVVQAADGTFSLEMNKDKILTYLKQFKEIDQTKTQAGVENGLKGLLAAKTPTKVSYKIVLVNAVNDAAVPTDGYTPGKFEGKFVEVNLAQQRMYLMNGMTLEKSFVVSSGKWSTPTPKGVFSIHGKTRRAYSAAFGLYMPYWQDFLNGEYGLHELPEWPNGYKEGQSHLGTPVSHGCVRLGVGDAGEVYNWTEIGTPVYIH